MTGAMKMTDPLEQALAAATYARTLMFRERSVDHMSEDLRGLSQLTDPDDLEAGYETAIELLAMLHPDELDRAASASVEQRRSPDIVAAHEA